MTMDRNTLNRLPCPEQAVPTNIMGIPRRSAPREDMGDTILQAANAMPAGRGVGVRLDTNLR